MELGNDASTANPSGDDGQSEPNFTRRRLAVGGALLGTVALLVGGLVWLTGGDGDGDDAVVLATTVPQTTTTSTTVAPTTTTTTVPPTTTTTTTTSTTTTSSTTTTMAPVTTLLENGVPVWPPYETLPPLDGIAALTGTPADDALAASPIIAVKVDNVGSARPQWGLDLADVIIEENVEQATRFVALFHTRLPDRAGPVRSARTGDLDLFASMNRPILAWSGGNRGVTNWIESAARSQVLVNFTAQKSPCYNRNSSRSAPHNLQLNPSCALDNVADAGPARSLWPIVDDWSAPEYFITSPDASFDVQMDGNRAGWVWDADAGLYRRSQNGRAHVSASGAQISMNNVVEMYVFHAPSPVDARSPNPVTIGRGRAVIHRNGVAIEAIWARRTAQDPFTFADEATGEWIPLDVGTTFVELVRDR
ncbi:DUF3048 domain-containing protein [Ilumatobacter coccineus]|uniref:DUF3048 domain-containing protein n=1 Tax=Ilumatobacter coccineus TaxID=467094 RepID=UPI000346A87B|nr:DUF3048 domain-containing protein [Ilumatobacter coccineus]